MVLKFKKTLKEWIPFYVDAIKNRLRRDLNLSDVFDVQATRDNIGLSGINNHTHYHDDRYIPKIDKEIDTRKQEITSLSNKLTTEHIERIAADDKERDERITSINGMQAALNKGITELKKLCNDLKNRLDDNEFVKSKDNANNIALKYEQKDGESAKSLHAYVDGSEVPLSSQSNNMLGMPDYAHMIRQNLGTTYIAPENGYIFTGGSSDDGYFNVYIDDILLCPYSDRYATASSNVIDSVFIFIPISKGQKYLVKSSGSWGTNVFKVYFVPMMK